MQTQILLVSNYLAKALVFRRRTSAALERENTNQLYIVTAASIISLYNDKQAYPQADPHDADG